MNRLGPPNQPYHDFNRCYHTLLKKYLIPEGSQLAVATHMALSIIDLKLNSVMNDDVIILTFENTYQFHNSTLRMKSTNKIFED